MQSGFDKIGLRGLLLVVAAPVALWALIWAGATSYCGWMERRLATRQSLLAIVPGMEAGCRDARQALNAFRRGAPGDPGGTGELGRWLREVGKSHGVDPNGLTIAKDGDADPRVPALHATFHAQQQLARLVEFLGAVQSGPRLVSFASIRLHNTGPDEPDRFAMDVNMRAHVVAFLSSDPPAERRP